MELINFHELFEGYILKNYKIFVERMGAVVTRRIHQYFYTISNGTMPEALNVDEKFNDGVVTQIEFVCVSTLANLFVTLRGEKENFITVRRLIYSNGCNAH